MLRIISRCFILIFFLPHFALASLSVTPDMYVGVLVGETNSHYDAKKAGLAQVDSRNLGFSGRAALGWQVFENLGIELAYLRFKNTRLLNMNDTQLCAEIREQSVDATLRGRINIKKHFFLNGRFGLAYLEARSDATLRHLSTDDYRRDRIAHVRPLIGLGASYHVNKHVVVEASWIHLLRHRAIPEGSLIGIGISYFFHRENLSILSSKP